MPGVGRHEYRTTRSSSCASPQRNDHDPPHDTVPCRDPKARAGFAAGGRHPARQPHICCSPAVAAAGAPRPAPGRVARVELARVHEREAALVLVQQGRRHFATQDAGEDAGFEGNVFWAARVRGPCGRHPIVAVARGRPGPPGAHCRRQPARWPLPHRLRLVLAGAAEASFMAILSPSSCNCSIGPTVASTHASRPPLPAT